MENSEKEAGLETAKIDLATAKSNFKKFLKTNNLKENEIPSDGALAKKMANHQNKMAKAEKALKIAKKESKPKKDRISKYDYPPDCDTAEKRKKYRAEQRSKLKKVGKAEKKAKKSEKAPEEKKKKTAPPKED